MVCFAANSLLCRLALSTTSIDATSFTSVRVLAGALTLWLIVKQRNGGYQGSGSWWSAAALLVYAAGFSFAYVQLPTGVGALILFGCVQMTMIGYGFVQGERQSVRQLVGIGLAMGGLVALLLPGATAPAPGSAALMALAGIGWAVYSLRGRGRGDPVQTTAGNFLRAAVLAVVLSLGFVSQLNLDWSGVVYAVASGAVASGVGYAIWYAALPALQATHAATVQLSVPVLAALAGVLVLQEPLSVRLVVTSVAILGGIALVYLTAANSSR
ncbi:MAG: DMT family transporter [Gammaproteobacteria bacterium]